MHWLNYYKSKDDKSNPDNYFFLSCFGKFFTAALNNRLNKYLENMNLLCEEISVFSKSYGKTNHISNLK